MTKMAYFITCHSNCTMKQLVELHTENVWHLHGLPLRHNTDRGPQFNNPYMRSLHRSLGIDQRLSTAYHPQTQGQVEGNNKWLETYLRMFCDYRQDDWKDFLHTAEFAYNNHFHPSLGTSPFYANYGYHPVYTDRATLGKGVSMPECLEESRRVQAAAQLKLDGAQAYQKRFADKHRGENPGLNIGDNVWLDTRNLSTDAPSKKLGAKRAGPFPVIQRISPTAYRIGLPNQWRIHNIFHVHLLTKTKPDTIPGRPPVPEPPVQVNDEAAFAINKSVNSHCVRPRFQAKRQG